MINTLEERKLNLLSQIEKLKEAIDRLRWLEYREMALYNCTGSVRYIVPDRLWENSFN